MIENDMLVIEKNLRKCDFPKVLPSHMIIERLISHTIIERFNQSSHTIIERASFFHNNYDRNVDVGYGDGWRTNYSVEIKYDATSNLYYMHKADGNKIYFRNNTCTQISYHSLSCKSISEDGSGMILERITYINQNV
ncbi:MAG: hypothetical protein WCS62_05515, partial [Bacilli bacterium]